MDSKDQELQFEENRQLLIDLNKSVGLLQTELELTRKEYVAPKDEVKVSGKLEVNTEKSVEVENIDKLDEWLARTSTEISKAIEDNKTPVIKSMTVDNIQDAITKDVSVNNWKEFAKLIEPMVKAIQDKELKTIVQKQDFVFPTSPSKAIPVRLSDGKAFYNAITAVANGRSVPEINGAVPVVNPDGSNIGGASSTGNITDGVDTAIKATVKDLSNSNPLATQIMDANGDAITSFGGGTQYTEGDTDASFTGTISLVEGAGNTAVTLKQPTQPTDTQPISASSLPLPTGAATAANQQTDALTDAQLRATAVPVSGTVAVTGVATAANQTSQITLQTQLESLIDTLQELVQRLSPLAGAMANTAQLRVVQTTAPSTAVTGPITSAQSIAEKAVAGISYPEKVAITNLTAIQSNINNAVA